MHEMRAGVTHHYRIRQSKLFQLGGLEGFRILIGLFASMPSHIDQRGSGKFRCIKS